MTNNCIFCDLPDDRVIDESVYWLTISDGYPVSPGHTLLLPKRHIKDYFEIDAAEYVELKTVIDYFVSNAVRRYRTPDGFATVVAKDWWVSRKTREIEEDRIEKASKT